MSAEKPWINDMEPKDAIKLDIVQIDKPEK